MAKKENKKPEKKSEVLGSNIVWENISPSKQELLKKLVKGEVIQTKEGRILKTAKYKPGGEFERYFYDLEWEKGAGPEKVIYRKPGTTPKDYTKGGCMVTITIAIILTASTYMLLSL